MRNCLAMALNADQLEPIFEAAIEIDCLTKRRGFIQQACSADVEMERRVEELVNNHFQAGQFLESPLPNLVAEWEESSECGVTEHPGTTIGPYKLIEQIGEGGFGVVFLAEQERPLRRQVA